MKPRKFRSNAQQPIYREITYTLNMPSDHRRVFTDEEKTLLRPIAETLAMLDGNAFFGSQIDDNLTGTTMEWYEQYLPEAWEVWKGNGGLEGWAALTCWGREHKLRQENLTLQGLWEQYQMALRLVQAGEHD